MPFYVGCLVLFQRTEVRVLLRVVGPIKVESGTSPQTTEPDPAARSVSHWFQLRSTLPAPQVLPDFVATISVPITMVGSPVPSSVRRILE